MPERAHAGSERARAEECERVRVRVRVFSVHIRVCRVLQYIAAQLHARLASYSVCSAIFTRPLAASRTDFLVMSWKRGPSCCAPPASFGALALARVEALACVQSGHFQSVCKFVSICECRNGPSVDLIVAYLVLFSRLLKLRESKGGSADSLRNKCVSARGS